jgi:hypothetical protein
MSLRMDRYSPTRRDQQNLNRRFCQEDAREPHGAFGYTVDSNEHLAGMMPL